LLSARLSATSLKLLPQKPPPNRVQVALQNVLWLLDKKSKRQDDPRRPWSKCFFKVISGTERHRKHPISIEIAPDFGLARLMRENEYEARVGARFPIKVSLVHKVASILVTPTPKMATVLSVMVFKD
uniref:Uncharacterized protein n=1 Tax=Parascaris equorum TaxID=6256 RepID=A0A914RUV2_PAREQ